MTEGQCFRQVSLLWHRGNHAKAGEATCQGGREKIATAGGGMRNAENPSCMNKADVSVHLCKNQSALNGEGPKTNNPDGMQESYPTLALDMLCI